MADLTSRACVKCGAIFEVGEPPTKTATIRDPENGDWVRKVSTFTCALDTHCGLPTTPCPSFDGDLGERVRQYKKWFGHPEAAEAQPVTDAPGWWNG